MFSVAKRCQAIMAKAMLMITILLWRHQISVLSNAKCYEVANPNEQLNNYYINPNHKHVTSPNISYVQYCTVVFLRNYNHYFITLKQHFMDK